MLKKCDKLMHLTFLNFDTCQDHLAKRVCVLDASKSQRCVLFIIFNYVIMQLLIPFHIPIAHRCPNKTNTIKQTWHNV